MGLADVCIEIFSIDCGQCGGKLNPENYHSLSRSSLESPINVKTEVIVKKFLKERVNNSKEVRKTVQHFADKKEQLSIGSSF